MHYNKKNKTIIWFFGQTLPICMKIVEFQSLKALPIWRFLDNFSLEKSCDRLVHWTQIEGEIFSLSVELSSFIFLLLYHELWVMIRNVHVLWTLCVDRLIKLMSCNVQIQCNRQASANSKKKIMKKTQLEIGMLWYQHWVQDAFLDFIVINFFFSNTMLPEIIIIKLNLIFSKWVEMQHNKIW